MKKRNIFFDLFLLITIFIVIIDFIKFKNNGKKSIDYKNTVNYYDYLKYIEETKIGVISFQGNKINQLSNKSNIFYAIIDNEALNDRDIFPHSTTYQSLFDFNIRNQDEKNKYSFEEYKEDIILSLRFYEFYNDEYLDNFDYIFIPPIGFKISDEYSLYLHKIIDNINQNHPNGCFYQIGTNEYFPTANLNDLPALTAKYPFTKIKKFNGILINPQTIRRMEFFSPNFYHIDRIDHNLQVYCEIGDIPIVIIPPIDLENDKR